MHTEKESKNWYDAQSYFDPIQNTSLSSIIIINRKYRFKQKGIIKQIYLNLLKQLLFPYI